MYEQFVIFFALLLTGFFLKKINILTAPMVQGLNKLIVSFIMPCFFVYKMATLEARDNLAEDYILCFGISCILFVIYGAYAYGFGKLRKLPRDKSGVAELAMTVSNNGVLGFPVAEMFFGTHGLMLMSASNIVTNLYMFSYGIILMERDSNEKQDRKKLLLRALKKLLNPNMAGIAVGFILYFCGIKLPALIESYCSQLSALCTPIAMICIGANLSNARLKEILQDRAAVETALNRVLVLPLLTGIVMALLKMPSIISAICVLNAGLPVAAMVPLVVGQEGKNDQLASRAVLISTVFSMITIPVMIQIIQIVFP